MLAAFVRDVTEQRAGERERERLISDLQAALQEVRQLSGLLPMCSHCKRIRDADGSWHQVDVYVSRHTNVSFTHGLCPECLKEHYPDYLDGVDP